MRRNYVKSQTIDDLVDHVQTRSSLRTQGHTALISKMEPKNIDLNLIILEIAFLPKVTSYGETPMLSRSKSKDFDFDVLMMPYDHALLKFNSTQKSNDTRYIIKKISSDLGREFQIETTRGLAKKFKLKFLFQKIYSPVIDYQRM